MEALYAQIVEAAGEVMHSDMASIQVLDHENDALRLIAHKGFDAEAEATWRWIEHDDATSCGHALKTKTRIVVPDIEADEFMACTPAQEQYRKAGIRAVQSTPLVGRAGHSLGMISTHWRMPHEPSERDLRIFDVLARQAADLIERKESEDALQRRAAQLRLLLDELNHRVKNTLATVQSIAHQTLRHAPTMAEGRKSLDARLIALSRAHNVLTREHWEGANLRELVAEALAAYSNGSGPRRFDVSGNDIRLLPKAGLAISMALHELATNAVKYGALSNENGHVRIRWGGGEDAQLFRLEWSEIDGPPIEQPRRLGFGSRLIKHGLAQDLGGVVELHFEPDGLVFAIDAPLKELCGGDDKPHPRPLDDRWER
ncbi:HWE histidine kinase domain-containing protein [Neorhizobium sp. CSC1952]|uniref:sensor histidine kinase n=1 Tax=Neorhizobium sp. CSC1952 TaxID=2978974 RepID=UPI002351EA36|nr:MULTISPECIES: HWE histidine kinase domain-containing protein [Rhizobium/Agrobacterium group]WJR69537.1 HWE histidine kinase domain-containing protein [Rhizobium sp. CSC1952]